MQGPKGRINSPGKCGDNPHICSRHTSKLDAIMHVDSSFALTICGPVHKPQQDVVSSGIDVSTSLIDAF